MENNLTSPVLVAMPVYNAMPYLVDAVASILQQTFTCFILLVIDDSSSDGSYEYIAQLADKRILLFKQNRGGPGSAMNIALDYALKNNILFIARMDADDISMPERLEKQIGYLQDHSEVAAISCNCLYTDEEGNPIGSSTVPMSSKLITLEIQCGLRGLVQGASVIRTQALAQLRGYDPEFPQAEDTDLFFRLSEHYTLSNLPEYLYSIRVNRNSLSTKNIHKNVLYHLYAIHCHKKRIRGLLAMSFQDYVENRNVFEKISYYQELILLTLWKAGRGKSRLFYNALAALVSPKRLIARIIRLGEALSYTMIVKGKNG